MSIRISVNIVDVNIDTPRRPRGQAVARPRGCQAHRRDDGEGGGKIDKQTTQIKKKTN